MYHSFPADASWPTWSVGTAVHHRLRGHVHLIAGLLKFPCFLFVSVLAAPGDSEGRIAEHEVEAEFTTQTNMSF